MPSVEPGIILENQFLGVLDPAFSAILEGSSRIAAMPRFPDLRSERISSVVNASPHVHYVIFLTSLELYGRMCEPIKWPPECRHVVEDNVRLR